MGGSLATVLTGDVGDGCGGWGMGAGDLGVSAFRGFDITVQGRFF